MTSQPFITVVGGVDTHKDLHVAAVVVNRSGFDGGSFYLIPISTLGVLVAV